LQVKNLLNNIAVGDVVLYQVHTERKKKWIVTKIWSDAVFTLSRTTLFGNISTVIAPGGWCEKSSD